MSKEWILNSATNRYKLNSKRSVGPTSENIRKCSPQSLDQWRDYYYNNVKSKEHLDELGERLFREILQNIIPEVKSVTKDDCKNYIHNLVIDRTYDGYNREREAVFNLLAELAAVEIKEASDEWDRGYNVDYYIEVKGKFIGLQIKPVPPGLQLAQIYKEYGLQLASHDNFTKKYGGKVFYVFSGKKDNNPFIHNKEVIDKIKAEIKRLEG